MAEESILRSVQMRPLGRIHDSVFNWLFYTNFRFYDVRAAYQGPNIRGHWVVRRYTQSGAKICRLQSYKRCLGKVGDAKISVGFGSNV
jgi:hypothetical protein